MKQKEGTTSRQGGQGAQPRNEEEAYLNIAEVVVPDWTTAGIPAIGGDFNGLETIHLDRFELFVLGQRQGQPNFFPLSSKIERTALTPNIMQACVLVTLGPLGTANSPPPPPPAAEVEAAGLAPLSLASRASTSTIL